jgi:hypothetical protein
MGRFYYNITFILMIIFFFLEHIKINFINNFINIFVLNIIQFIDQYCGSYIIIKKFLNYLFLIFFKKIYLKEFYIYI